MSTNLNWPDLSGYGACLQVSAKNKYREKTAMLTVNDQNQFFGNLSRVFPGQNVDELIKAAHFLKVDNDEDKLIFYYKHPEKSAFDLKDLEKLFPTFDRKNNVVSTPAEQVYTKLPFKQHLPEWQKYFNQAAEQYHQIPEVFIDSKLNSNNILDHFRQSVANANPLFNAVSVNTPIPLNKLQEYGYRDIFMKVYPDEETALSSGINPDNLIKAKLSPFSLALNVENDGSILAIEDIRHIPEIFAYNPYQSLALDKNVNVFHEANQFNIAFSEVVKHASHIDLFHMPLKAFDPMIEQLANDLAVIENTFVNTKLGTPLLSDEQRHRGIPKLSKNDDGVWLVQHKVDDESQIMNDKAFVEAMIIRHHAAAQLVNKCPNPRVYNAGLTESYNHIAASANLKFNEYFLAQVKRLEQKRLEAGLNNVVVDEFLDELNVNFEAIDKPAITPESLLAQVQVGVVKAPESPIAAVLDESQLKAQIHALLNVPSGLIDQSNEKVAELAPAMLQARQILDIYVLPKAQEAQKELEILYSETLSYQYDRIQGQIAENLKSGEAFNSGIYDEVVQEVQSTMDSINQQFSDLTKVIEGSKKLVGGISASTDKFLFNTENYYYKTNDAAPSEYTAFNDSVELENHKRDLFDRLDTLFKGEIITIHSEEFSDLIGNDVAIESLKQRASFVKHIDLNQELNKFHERNIDADKTQYSDTLSAIMSKMDAENSTGVQSKKQEYIALFQKKQFDPDFLQQSLKERSKALSRYLSRGAMDFLQSASLVEPIGDNVRREKTIVDEIFNKAQTSKRSFDYLKNQNAVIEITALKLALKEVHADKDWSFLESESLKKDISVHLFESGEDYIQDLKNIGNIERQLNSAMLGSVVDLKIDPDVPGRLVQNKVLGQNDDFKLSYIQANEFDEAKHIDLPLNTDKAALKAFENTRDALVGKLLYLSYSAVTDAKELAAFVIAKDEQGFAKKSKAVFGTEFTIEDFNAVSSVAVNGDELKLNEKAIGNSKVTLLEAYNTLQLADLYSKTALGNVAFKTNHPLNDIANLALSGSNFSQNLNYLKIQPIERNFSFKDENDYLAKQIDSAIQQFDDRYGEKRFAQDDHHLALAILKAGDTSYIRILDNLDEDKAAFFGNSVMLEKEAYKKNGFTPVEAISMAIQFTVKLDNRNLEHFMPPAKFTLKKYYDGNLNYFDSVKAEASAASPLFKSLPESMAQQVIYNSNARYHTNDPLNERRREIYEKFEDLVYSGETKEARDYLATFELPYDFNVARKGDVHFFLPKNLTNLIDHDAVVSGHPLDLAHRTTDRHALANIFKNGFLNAEEELSYVNGMRFPKVIRALDEQQRIVVKPLVYTEQLAVNEEFAEKYKQLISTADVQALLIDHVKALVEVVRNDSENPIKEKDYPVLSLISKNQVKGNVFPDLYIVNTDRHHKLETDILRVDPAIYDHFYDGRVNFREVKTSESSILESLHLHADLGSVIHNLAISELPIVAVNHKDEYANKQLESLNAASVVTNTLSDLFLKADAHRGYLQRSGRNFAIVMQESTESDYAKFKLAPLDQALEVGQKTLCVFDITQIKKIDHLIEFQRNFVNTSSIQSKIFPTAAFERKNEPLAQRETFLGDVGQKFGGAHKDRYGDYISLEYISATGIDQTATDYRKAKILPNKEFKQWYDNTALPLEDKLVIKALYDYCPTKPLFSDNAKQIDSLRLKELNGYCKVVGLIRDSFMVESKEELELNIAAAKNSLSKAGFNDDEGRKYVKLYDKSTKNNYKNHFEILQNLPSFYKFSNDKPSIDVQYEKILDKTAEKEFGDVLILGKVFDFMYKSKVDASIDAEISNMLRTGQFVPELEPFIRKSAIDNGLVVAIGAPVNVADLSNSTTTPDVTAVKEKVNRAASFEVVKSEVDLERNLNNLSVRSSVYGLLNFDRIGPIHRSGQNKDSFDIKTEFNLKGVEVGNNMKPVAQPVMNLLYDSLKDLQQTLGFKSQEGFLNLGVAIASRGIRGSAAHYELEKNVLNLTRDQGAGTFIHEYAHALDAYLGTYEKAELYKSKEGSKYSGLNEAMESIPGFDQPMKRMFLSDLIDKGFTPNTDAGKAFETIYYAMMYRPNANLPDYQNDQEQISREFNGAYNKLIDTAQAHVMANKDIYASTDLRTLDAFFDWQRDHYAKLLEKQFDKIGEFIKKFENEYKDNADLSFFKDIQAKSDLVVSKLSCNFGTMSFVSYGNYQERRNDTLHPDRHLPTKDIESKISVIMSKAGLSLDDFSNNLKQSFAHEANARLYKLVEENMPAGINDPYSALQKFFYKNDQVFANSNQGNLTAYSFKESINSDYKNSCLNMDQSLNKTKAYYATSTEMFARYMETYIHHQLNKTSDLNNSFLIDAVPVVSPKGLELENCYNLANILIDKTVKTVFDKDLVEEMDLKNQVEKQVTKESSMSYGM